MNFKTSTEKVTKRLDLIKRDFDSLLADRLKEFLLQQEFYLKDNLNPGEVAYIEEFGNLYSNYPDAMKEILRNIPRVVSAIKSEIGMNHQDSRLSALQDLYTYFYEI